MGKFFTKYLLCLLALILTAPAFAVNSYDYKFYLGLGLQRTFVHGKASISRFLAVGEDRFGEISLLPQQYNRYMDGKSITAGYNLHNFGFEFGYTQFDNIYYPTLFFVNDQSQGNTGKQSGNNIFLDAILYYQYWGNFVAKLRIGAGFLTTKYDVYSLINGLSGTGATINQQTTTTFWGNKFGPRIGCALQWNFAKHWSSEITLVYQGSNQLLEDLTTTKISLNYYI